MQDGIESYIARTIYTRRATTLFSNIIKATCFPVCLPFSLCPHAGSNTWAVAQTLCAVCVSRLRKSCVFPGTVLDHSVYR